MLFLFEGRDVTPDGELRCERLARELEDILAADPDPVARPTLYLDERYRGPVDKDGIRLPDTRGRHALTPDIRPRPNSIGITGSRPSLSSGIGRNENGKLEEESLEARKAGTRAPFERFLAEEFRWFPSRRPSGTWGLT